MAGFIHCELPSGFGTEKDPSFGANRHPNDMDALRGEHPSWLGFPRPSSIPFEDGTSGEAWSQDGSEDEHTLQDH